MEKKDTRTTWTLKGVSEETRSAVRLSAKKAGIPMNKWVERTLDQKAREELSHSATVPAEQDHLAKAMEKALTPLVERLERLEKQPIPWWRFWNKQPA